jgi:cardiolipin synthase
MTLTRFEIRLLGVVALLGLLQGSVFGAFVYFYQLPLELLWVFLPLHGVYHGALWLALRAIRGDHRALDGTPLSKIGIPNLVTLSRVTSLPVMGALFLLARDRTELASPLVVYIVSAFLTDLLDGFLARNFGWGTHLGKILDSSTDYLLGFVLALMLGITGVLPLWLLGFIVFRLLFQVSGLVWLAVVRKKRVAETTFWGKASLFVLMLLFAVEILVFLRLPGLENTVFVFAFEVVAAAAMVISTVDKLLFFRRQDLAARS